MRSMIFLILFLGALGLGMQAYRILTAEHDPAVWHVDPLEAADQPTPNGYRVAPSDKSKFPPDDEAPVYAGNAQVLAKAFDDFVMSQLFVQRIAGRPDDLWMTYVQRTPKLRIPDYISVKFIELGKDRSSIAIFSRSRYGYGDLGVNEARVRLWLGTLQSFEIEQTEPAEETAEGDTEDSASQ
jgi:uncharacterized protein DUF1499